jgi:hypothetical protein
MTGGIAGEPCSDEVNGDSSAFSSSDELGSDEVNGDSSAFSSSDELGSYEVHEDPSAFSSSDELSSDEVNGDSSAFSSSDELGSYEVHEDPSAFSSSDELSSYEVHEDPSASSSAARSDDIYYGYGYDSKATSDPGTTSQSNNKAEKVEELKSSMEENAPEPPDTKLENHPGLDSKEEQLERGIESRNVVKAIKDIFTNDKVSFSTYLDITGHERLAKVASALETFTGAVGGRALGGSAMAVYDTMAGYWKSLSDAQSIQEFRGKIDGYTDAYARWATGESVENLPNDIPKDIKTSWKEVGSLDELKENYPKGAKQAQENIKDMKPAEAEAFREHLRNELGNDGHIDTRDNIREEITNQIRENADSETQRLTQGM